MDQVKGILGFLKEDIFHEFLVVKKWVSAYGG
jgi:hypothetical protein